MKQFQIDENLNSDLSDFQTINEFSIISENSKNINNSDSILNYKNNIDGDINYDSLIFKLIEKTEDFSKTIFNLEKKMTFIDEMNHKHQNYFDKINEISYNVSRLVNGAEDLGFL
jgi:spore coat polysaccharide biosynthesis predicted glycosyltransferase SpsG